MATKIWTFGRAGLDAISRIEVLSVDESDEETSFKCEAIGDTVAKGIFTARQIQGHLEPNVVEGRGQQIPVSFVDDDNWNGLWEVTGGSVSWEAISVAGGIIPFELTLKKVPRGFNAPLMELATWGSTMDNSQGWTSALPLLAVPSEAITVDLPPLVTDTPTTYNGELSNALVYQDAEFLGGSTTVRGVVPVRTNYRLLASDYYKSACKLYDDASNLFIWTGRQVKWDSSRIWILAHDQTQCQVTTDGSGKLRITVKHWDGTTWDSVSWDVLSDGSAVTKAIAVTHGEVLHNSPERVTAMFRFEGTASVRAAYLTVTLYRGNPVVNCKIKSVVSTDWGIQESTASAGTLTSGRFEQTTAVNGNKYIAFSPEAITAVGGSGRIYLTANGTLFRFGLSAIVNAAGSPPLSNTQLRDAYAGVMGIRLSAVGS